MKLHESHHILKKIMKTHTPDQLLNFISTGVPDIRSATFKIFIKNFDIYLFNLETRREHSHIQVLGVKSLGLFCDDSQGQKKKKKGSHPYLLSSDWHTKPRIEK